VDLIYRRRGLAFTVLYLPVIVQEVYFYIYTLQLEKTHGDACRYKMRIWPTDYLFVISIHIYKFMICITGVTEFINAEQNRHKLS